MATNSSSTRQFNIEQIIKLAVTTAGVLPVGAARSGAQWDNMATYARDLLDMEMDHLQTEGAFQRAVEFYDVTVSAEDGEYDLPNTTLSVTGDGMFSTDGETQTVVKAIGREEYHALSQKSAVGHPTMMYVQKHETITVFLWPIPSSTGTLTLQRQRLYADSDDGTRTMDLERFWDKYIVFELAHMIALSGTQSINRCGYLRAQAERALAKCKRKAAQTAPLRITNGTLR